MTNTTFAFPDENVDPRKKQDKSWILQYLKAAYNTSNTTFKSYIYFGQNRLNEIRAYALGQQPIDKYKKMKLGSDQADASWENIDWTIVDYLSKYRNIAVAKIATRSYDVQCRAVDPLSKSEEDNFFNSMKTKIIMREAAKKMGSELVDSPALKAAPSEPQDEEQLQMDMDFGYKSTLAMEAEMGIQYVQQNNNYEEVRKRVIEDLVDFGMGAEHNYIDVNGQVITEHIDIRQLVLSPFTQRNGKDVTYWGIVKEVWLGDLAYFYDANDMKKIGEMAKGNWGNPAYFNYNQPYWYNHCKILVFDCKFKSYNTNVYEERIDKTDNLRLGKTDYSNLSKAMSINNDGELQEDTSQPKYYSQTIEVVYKGKWIIDTDYIYDYGLSENMVRKPSDRCNTSLDLQLYSWNFDRGKFSGLTEKLIPLEDQACLVWFKMQNLAAKLIPYIISLDMSALEGVDYGKGGEKNSPENITEFLFSNFVAIYRSRDLLDPSSGTQPLSPVNITASGQLYAFGELRNQLLMVIEQMKQISGLNELTDGSTPNPKMLTTPANAAIESTNNALYAIQFADQQLVKANAENALMKLQIAVKLGKVEGYMRVMGQETVRFMSINPDISAREFGIFCQVVPTYEERQMLLQQVTAKESQGILDITDQELIMNCTNIRQAMRVLAWRIKKRKEQMQQQELQKIQANNEGQAQTALQIEQAKQQTLVIANQLKLTEIETEKRWEYQIEAMKKQADFNGEVVQSQARTIGHQIQAAAKKESAEIAAAASIKNASKTKAKT